RATGRAVLAYDYPGYGKSEGAPCEAGCYAAAEAALGWLESEGVPPSEVLHLGESLGSAVAVEMASRHGARLLVLLCPFSFGGRPGAELVPLAAAARAGPVAVRQHRQGSTARLPRARRPRQRGPRRPALAGPAPVRRAGRAEALRPAGRAGALPPRQRGVLRRGEGHCWDVERGTGYVDWRLAKR
ncbi:MAG: alpha/beta hydrolase, partial [Gemmataceae bacterium]|nr:alpha/beta hydrolase [Gemmataceae bacterium]